MTFHRRESRTILAIALYLSGLSLAATTTNPIYALSVSAWTCVEMVVSLLITTVVGSIALFVTSPRSAHLLDLAVSRGLEVTAALPIVLVCAVSVVTFGWRMPYAIALVIGALNGLTCLRLVTLGKGRAKSAGPLARSKQALVASISELVPQLVGLEATIEFLGLFDSPWQGGLGKPLGTAVTSGNPIEILTWSLLCMAVTVGTQRLLHGRPDEGASMTVAADEHLPGASPPRAAS